MALIDQQLLQERFTERGIGTSPLSSRATRQRDIERLRNLRKEVVASQTRAEREQRERALKTIQQTLRRPKVRSARLGGDGDPLGTISRTTAGRFRVQLNVQPGSGLGGTLAKEGAAQEFETTDELQAFLKNHPELRGRLVSPASLEQGINPELAQDLGISIVSGSQARQALGRTARPRGFNVLSSVRGVGAPSGTLGPGRNVGARTIVSSVKQGPQTVRQGIDAVRTGNKISPNLRTHVNEFGVQKIRNLARVGGVLMVAMYDALQEGMTEGALGEGIDALIKDGLI